MLEASEGCAAAQRREGAGRSWSRAGGDGGRSGAREAPARVCLGMDSQEGTGDHGWWLILRTEGTPGTPCSSLAMQQAQWGVGSRDGAWRMEHGGWSR